MARGRHDGYCIHASSVCPSVGVVVVNNCGSFGNYNSYKSEILQAYLGWYSTVPQCISKYSVEPLDFGKTLKFKNWPFSYILRELCQSFFFYNSYRSEILQAYLGWYYTLPQYVSENSVEPQDFGETLNFKN